jgi:redox-sensitive bicupin YhaK (pirin superfamily)
VSAATIPATQRAGAAIRVVAGEVDGVRGPVTEIAANPVYLDVTLAANSNFVYPVPHDHMALAYVFEGAGRFGAEAEAVAAVHMIMFAEGDQIEVSSDEGVRFMLIAGASIREPIAPYGPFVMNTDAEIRQAIYELRNGTFIKEEAAA